MEEEMVYFELNNWCPGKDYPDAAPFDSWFEDDCNIYFNNENWVIENKLCVVRTIVDMSINFCITAPKSWVLKNCPSLLTEHTKFLRFYDEYGNLEGRFGCPFNEYSEENIRIEDLYPAF